MKLTKILYWISLIFCWAQLALVLFGPFGGFIAIYNKMKRGMFEVMSGYTVIDLDYPPYSNHPAVPVLLFINRGLTIILFSTLFASIFLPFLRLKDNKVKYLIGISLCLTGMLIVFAGRGIWRNLVYTYVGI
jgi:hypothetical protein